MKAVKFTLSITLLMAGYLFLNLVTKSLAGQPHQTPKSTIGVIGTMGFLVREIAPGSPAEQAGIKASDIIQTVNQKPISSIDDFRQIVGQAEPRQNVEITYLRFDALKGAYQEETVIVRTVPLSEMRKR